MPQLRESNVVDCLYCSGPVHLFRHAKTWRLECQSCGTWWRYPKDPRKIGIEKFNWEGRL
jgi:hypothetical protein